MDLILDQPEIEVFENRRIVSHTDGFTEITHWLSVRRSNTRRAR